MDRPALGRYACPGCGCHYSRPPVDVPRAIDLSCRFCGHKDTRLDPTLRICEACGICAICKSQHTVMLKDPRVVKS